MVSVDEWAFTAWMQATGRDDRHDFDYAFCGFYENELEFTEELIRERDLLWGLEQTLHMYFDVQRYSNDLFEDCFFSLRINDRIAVFKRLGDEGR